MIGRDGANIPAGGEHAYDFARGLECPRFVRIAFTRQTTAETQEAAIRRPIDMINLFDLVFDAQPTLANGWVIGIQIDRRRGNFVIACTPGKLLAVRADAGATTRNAQVDDLIAMGFNRQNSMAKAHPSVNG